MSPVYLLGAGFSRAISELMPTMAELSAAVKAELVGYDIPGRDTPVSGNFEQWLSYLIEDPPWLTAADQAQNRAGFMRVAEAVHAILSRLQAEVVESQDECPDWLRRLVIFWQQSSAKVITFNYDSLTELAWRIYAAPSNFGPDKPHSPRWWKDLYPIPITDIGRRLSLTFGNMSPQDGMDLLKLHGSLNWRYSGPDGAQGDPLFDVLGGNPPAWTAESLAPTETAQREAYDLVPMIIPPTAVKSPYYGNAMLRANWRYAREALKGADELVMMGFSLPASDALVSAMLAAELPIGCAITPLNRNTDILKRIDDVFDTDHYPRRVNDGYIGADPIAAWVDANAT
jgi:hypothetical protein